MTFCSARSSASLPTTMDSQAERNIVDWDENDVHNWLTNLGYPQYESQIKGVYRWHWW